MSVCRLAMPGVTRSRCWVVGLLAGPEYLSCPCVPGCWRSWGREHEEASPASRTVATLLLRSRVDGVDRGEEVDVARSVFAQVDVAGKVARR